MNNMNKNWSEQYERAQTSNSSLFRSIKELLELHCTYIALEFCGAHIYTPTQLIWFSTSIRYMTSPLPGAVLRKGGLTSVLSHLKPTTLLPSCRQLLIPEYAACITQKASSSPSFCLHPYKKQAAKVTLILRATKKYRSRKLNSESQYTKQTTRACCFTDTQSCPEILQPDSFYQEPR